MGKLTKNLLLMEQWMDKRRQETALEDRESRYCFQKKQIVIALSVFDLEHQCV